MADVEVKMEVCGTDVNEAITIGRLSPTPYFGRGAAILAPKGLIGDVSVDSGFVPLLPTYYSHPDSYCLL